MAALIVALGIMAIMMTVAMPVWKQAAQREKEEELIFRGQQYVHALALFSRKYASAAPPNLNVLVEQRFLRKKYKDPITNDDFAPILAGQNVPGAATPGAGAPGATVPGGTPTQPGSAPQPGSTSQPATAGRGPTTFGTAPGAASPFGRGGTVGQPGTPGGAVGGIIGVTSKSKEKSIRLYNGRNHYNEWAFVLTQQTQAPGVGAPGTVAPGQRGQPGQPQRGGPTSPFGGRGDGRGRGTPGRGFGPGVSPFPPAQPIFPPGRGRSGR